MSCGMPNATLQLCPAPVAKDDGLGRLCANISQGLHALAQPLTILRSAVAASNAPGVAPLDRQRYLELSSLHVERTCGLFECLQDLVIASQIEAECEPVELSEVLADVVEDRKTVLQTSGIELRVVAPTGTPTLQGDAARTLQALSAALKIAASVSSPGDAVELLVATRNGFVELVLQNKRIHGQALNSAQRLTLALAETNVRSQQGKYECVEDPLRVFIALPLQDAFL